MQQNEGAKKAVTAKVRIYFQLTACFFGISYFCNLYAVLSGGVFVLLLRACRCHVCDEGELNWALL